MSVFFVDASLVVKWFVPEIWYVASGKGEVWRRNAAVEQTVQLRRTRPYRPQTNGKAERFVQTLTRSWAYAVSYPSSWRRTRALRPWLRYYNLARPHAALGYQPPCVRFPRLAQ